MGLSLPSWLLSPAGVNCPSPAWAASLPSGYRVWSWFLATSPDCSVILSGVSFGIWTLSVLFQAHSVTLQIQWVSQHLPPALPPHLPSTTGSSCGHTRAGGTARLGWHHRAGLCTQYPVAYLIADVMQTVSPSGPALKLSQSPELCHWSPLTAPTTELPNTKLWPLSSV